MSPLEPTPSPYESYEIQQKRLDENARHQALHEVLRFAQRSGDGAIALVLLADILGLNDELDGLVNNTSANLDTLTERERLLVSARLELLEQLKQQHEVR